MASIDLLALLVVGGALGLLAYAYVGYPVILWIIGRTMGQDPPAGSGERVWPTVTLSVPVYNEEDQMEGLLENLLRLDYPSDRVQILVISDASTDRTEEIVSRFADRGVELLRVSERGGKTKAENAAVPFLRGQIVVNTDASIRLPPGSLKALVAEFDDPEVGLASGCDRSVGVEGAESNVGESGYVGYEMAVRSLETRVAGIVGASGCYYAIRSQLHRTLVPESLSRDFAAALHTWEHGFKAVSVPSAVCFVPRATSLRREYQRKVRTITRGMETLAFKKAMLNPLSSPVTSWMLLSHKVSRWALPWVALAGILAVGVLALTFPMARLALAGIVVFLGLAWAGWVFSERPGVPRVFSIPAFIVVGNVAAAHAFLRFLRGDRNPVWEPTRRTVGRVG